jgi:hypothetical protein
MVYTPIKNKAPSEPAPFRLSRIDGGLNLREEPSSIQDNQSGDMLNVNCDDRGSLQKRPGQELFFAESLGPGSIQGFFDFYKKDGTLIPLVAHGGKLYRLEWDIKGVIYVSKMSDYLENALINATLRNVPYTSPGTVYLALYTADPTDADTPAKEVSGASYARQPITFTNPNNGVTSNSADIIFPAGTESWGTITHVGIKDALTNGNLLYHGKLTYSKSVASGDQFKVLANQLTVTLD